MLIPQRQDPVYTNMLKEIIQAGKIRGGKGISGAVRIKSKGGDSPVHAANLCIYLASDFSDGITGKLISAVWDNWKGFDKNISEIKKFFALHFKTGRWKKKLLR